jgi:hypothetical protein
MRDIAQVFRTLWERAGEFNSVPILTPKLIPLGDCGRITNRNGGSGESRLLACSSRQPAANRFRAHIRLGKKGHSAQPRNAAGWQPALRRSASSVAAME